MFCRYCGMQNYDNAAFCHYCGSPLTEIRQKKSKALLMILISSLIVLIIAVVALLFLSSSSTEHGYKDPKETALTWFDGIIHNDRDMIHKAMHPDMPLTTIDEVESEDDYINFFFNFARENGFTKSDYSIVNAKTCSEEELELIKDILAQYYYREFNVTGVIEYEIAITEGNSHDDQKNMHIAVAEIDNRWFYLDSVIIYKYWMDDVKNALDDFIEESSEQSWYWD